MREGRRGTKTGKLRTPETQMRRLMPPDPRPIFLEARAGDWWSDTGQVFLCVTKLVQMHAHVVHQVEQQ